MKSKKTRAKRSSDLKIIKTFWVYLPGYEQEALHECRIQTFLSKHKPNKQSTLTGLEDWLRVKVML